MDKKSPLVGNAWYYRKDCKEGGAGRGRGKPQAQIRFGLYNIRNGHNGGLESALRGMTQANLDLRVLHENKLTGGVYTYRLVG